MAGHRGQTREIGLIFQGPGATGRPEALQGKSLSSLLPGLGKSLSDNAKAAGYKVVTK
jgi:hypothetical protein